MPLPGACAGQRRGDPASAESRGPVLWAPHSGPGGAAPGQQWQAVCAKCSRQMCPAVVLFLVAKCAQTTPMIAPLPAEHNFPVDGSVVFFKSGESNPTLPIPGGAAYRRPPCQVTDQAEWAANTPATARPGQRQRQAHCPLHATTAGGSAALHALPA